MEALQKPFEEPAQEASPAIPAGFVLEAAYSFLQPALQANFLPAVKKRAELTLEHGEENVFQNVRIQHDAGKLVLNEYGLYVRRDP